MGLRLSQLYEKLDMIRKNDIESSFNLVLEKIEKNSAYIQDIKYVDHLEMASLKESIRSLFDEYRNNILNIERSIQTILENNHDIFLSESFNHYQKYFQKMSYEDHLMFHNSVKLPNIENERFIGKIKQFISWQDPACLVGSKNTNILKYFPGAEPVYSIEHHREYFEKQLNLFPKSFGKKIRCYTFDEIKYLPKDVFNIIIIHNEFPFLPWIEIKKHLRYFSECLSPQGSLIFNYNDCSKYLGFLDFENKVQTYSTYKMFQEAAVELDLSIDENFESSFSNFSMMVLKKKGVKPTAIKRYPSIGMISNLELDDLAHKVRKDRIMRKIKSLS